MSLATVIDNQRLSTSECATVNNSNFNAPRFVCQLLWVSTQGIRFYTVFDRKSGKYVNRDVSVYFTQEELAIFQLSAIKTYGVRAFEYQFPESDHVRVRYARKLR